MNIERVDVFENETEIKSMVKRLQNDGLRQMAVPDALWHTEKHKLALKSARTMGKKVLAKL